MGKKISCKYYIGPEESARDVLEFPGFCRQFCYAATAPLLN